MHQQFYTSNGCSILSSQCFNEANEGYRQDFGNGVVSLKRFHACAVVRRLAVLGLV